MHVQSPEPWNVQQFGRQHVSVIEREQKIRVQFAQRKCNARIFGASGRQYTATVLMRKVRYARKPALLIGVIKVGVHQRHIDLC